MPGPLLPGSPSVAFSQTHISLLGRLADPSGDGGGEAWAEFVDRYGDLIRSFCLRRGLQPADCEDVSQDVLLSLSKSMPQFRYDPSKGLFRSYLKTVVMNAIARRSRQNLASGGLSGVEGTNAAGSEGSEEEQWEGEWRQYHIRRAMRTIDSEFRDSDRAAFQKYAIEARNAREVAAELGMSVDAVYQAKSRIVRRLGELIEYQVSEEG